MVGKFTSHATGCGQPARVRGHWDSREPSPPQSARAALLCAWGTTGWRGMIYFPCVSHSGGGWKAGGSISTRGGARPQRSVSMICLNCGVSAMAPLSATDRSPVPRNGGRLAPVSMLTLGPAVAAATAWVAGGPVPVVQLIPAGGGGWWSSFQPHATVGRVSCTVGRRASEQSLCRPAAGPSPCGGLDYSSPPCASRAPIVPQRPILHPPPPPTSWAQVAPWAQAALVLCWPRLPLQPPPSLQRQARVTANLCQPYPHRALGLDALLGSIPAAGSVLQVSADLAMAGSAPVAAVAAPHPPLVPRQPRLLSLCVWK